MNIGDNSGKFFNKLLAKSALLTSCFRIVRFLLHPFVSLFALGTGCLQ